MTEVLKVLPFLLFVFHSVTEGEKNPHMSVWILLILQVDICLDKEEQEQRGRRFQEMCKVF